MLGSLARVCSAAPAALAVAAGVAFANVNVVLTATVIQIGGLGWETLDQDIMESTFGGLLNDGTNTFVNIPWDGKLGTIGASVSSVSDSLYAALVSTPGPKVAVGLSGSTMAINDVMRRLEAQRAIDPTSVPSPEDVSFMVAGDAERGLLPALVPFFGKAIPGINYTVRPIPVTAYDITVVKGEYDGAADWPDRPWNLLAFANALAGSGAFEGPDGEEIFGSIHFDAIFTDFTTVPAKNVTTTVNSAGGTTTTYLIPTPSLPILLPLVAQGVPQPVVDALNSVLKPIVDFGYSRNDWRPPTSGVPRPATRPQRGAQVRAQVNAAPVSATPIAATAMPEATDAKVTGAKTTAAKTTA
ncbi:MAG: PE-PPE domain-containing protein, partial [Mycobacterium sp.]